MASQPEIKQCAAKSCSTKQIELVFVLKRQLDLVYKQLNHYRGTCKSIDRFNRAVSNYKKLHLTSVGQQSPDTLLIEFVKFEQNYRVWRKRLCKLNRKLRNVDLYEKMYDLYECLIDNPDNGIGVISIDSKTDDIFIAEDDIEIKLESSELDTSKQFSLVTADRLPRRSDRTAVTKTQATQTTDSDVPRRSKASKNSKKFNKQAITKSFTNEDTFTESHSFNEDIAISSKAKTKRKLSNTLLKTSRRTTKKSRKVVARPVVKASTVGHSPAEMVQCDVEDCQYSTSRPSNLKRHQKLVHGTKLKMCKVQGCQYSSSGNLGRHSHFDDVIDDRPFKCDKCAWAFKLKSNLTEHQAVHEGKRLECPFEGCSAGYTRQKHLYQHVQIVHTKEAPLLHCGFEGCSYSSYRTQALKVHRTIHTDERPFLCNECDEKFKTKDSLNKHKLRTHENQPRFRCAWPGCEQAYRSSSSLSTHKRVHENYRRYKCDWAGCQYAANHSAHLKKHHSTVHLKQKSATKQSVT